MSCRNCIELEQFLHSANVPDAPESLVGLTEAALRNRKHQREERIQKLKGDLEKHRKVCTELVEA